MPSPQNVSSLALVILLTACSAQQASSPTDAAPVVSAAPPPSAAPVASAAPPPSAPAPVAPAPAQTAEPTAAPSASAAAEAPLPNVKVSNIGIHIGGGPNDDATKEPIRRSVHPHFDAFKRCWALVEEKKKPVDFGVDLLIDKAGGKAQVSLPRSAGKGPGFKECVVKVYEEIDFLKPKGGTTKVSYSLRFTPGK